MYQQINMYQPVFRRQRKIFSATTLLGIVILAAAMLLAIYNQARWTVHGLQRTSADLIRSYQQLDGRFTALETADTAHGKDRADAEFTRLQEEIETHTVLLERIERLAFTTSEDFGDIFEALASRPTPGLWLTGIRADREGNTEIRGTALDPNLVPRYLQQMSQYPPFAAQHNGSVNLLRPVTDQPEVDFILSYHAQEATP